MVDSCNPFVLYKQYPGGGTIWLMMGLDNSGSDYNDIMTIAESLAESGHEVIILHAVHYKDPLYREVYGELIGTRYYRKCPDLLVNGEFVEYESFKTTQPKRAFRNMLHNGLEQADCLIIRSCNLSASYMTRQIQGYAQNGLPVSFVWIFDGKVVTPLYNTVG